VSQHHFDADLEAHDPAPPAGSRNLLQVFWQRKSLLILGAVVGGVAGALVYTQYAPVYQSSAQVLVVKKRSDPLPVAGGDPRVAFMEDYVATHLILIRSPLIVERAVQKRDLRSLKSFARSGDPSGAILASLVVGREKDANAAPNNIINLSYRGPVAEDCGTVLSAVVDSYKDFLDETYRNVSDDTLELITRGRDVLQKELSEKEQAYGEFRKKSPLLWKGKDGINVEQERVAGIEEQRSKLMIRQAELAERLKTVEKAIADKRPRGELLALALPPEPPEGKSATLTPEQTIEQALVPLLLQEQQLLQDFGEDHPDVRSVRKRIALLRKIARTGKLPGERGADGPDDDNLPPIVDPVDRYVNTLRRDLRESQATLESLTRLLDDEQKRARDLVTYETQDEAYRNEIERSQEMYKGIIKRLQEINLVRDAGGFDARPLSKPGPGFKVAPSLTYILLSGLVLGLVAGGGLAYLAEVTDKGFRTPDEIRRRLGLPVFGHIPLLEPDAEARAKADAGQPVLDPLLVSYYRPKSPQAEAYRAVRTALYFSTQGEGHRVVQVTSPDMGDGKSTLAVNLAISVAQSGKRVVLIDADLRRPRLHKILGVAVGTGAGLPAVIDGRAGPTDAVLDTPVPGLFLLPCGTLPPNPAELLISPRFQELLEALRARYDFVLVDTPPLLAVTDPCVVAPRVDGVLLTLRLSKQSRPKAERAKEILNTLQAKILGVVVNGVNKHAGNGRYAPEHYEYSYSPDEYDAEQGGGYYPEDVGTAGGGADAPAAPPTIPRGGHGGRTGLLKRFIRWWV
jgi:capsular exopolysaccharide synthesis family protein